LLKYRRHPYEELGCRFENGNRKVKKEKGGLKVKKRVKVQRTLEEG